MASAKGRFESWSDSSDAAASSPMMSGRVAMVCASLTKTTPSLLISSRSTAPRGDAPGRSPADRFCRASTWSKSASDPPTHAAALRAAAAEIDASRRATAQGRCS